MEVRGLQRLCAVGLATPARSLDDVAFAAEACRLLAGVDLFAGVDKPVSRAAVLRAFARYDAGNSENAIAGGLADRGFAEISPAAAIPGDVGILRKGAGAVTAACRIEQGWLMKSDIGIAVRRKVDRAWSVAHS